MFFYLIRHARALKCIFSLAFCKAKHPFKSHTCRIYSYLRVVPSAIITEHHSLCIRSGDLACCNCLRKIRKFNPEIALVDTSSGSSLTQALWVLVTQVPNTVQANPRVCNLTLDTML